ncbi:MAG TPA: DUF4105 domain-containing protein [Longimicrobiales bacterium]
MSKLRRFRARTTVALTAAASLLASPPAAANPEASAGGETTAAATIAPIATAARGAARDAARGPAQDAAEPSPGEIAAAADLRVYLVTMGPGDAVWERFGHNAIRILDPSTGVDVTYNYGMFDFGAEDFFPRFLRGDMLYWMQGFGTRAVVNAYARANRSVYAQELNLTAKQKARLRAFLAWNEREENRYYAYDYYRDNCSTRVRDALDRVLDGQIEAALGDVPTTATYRSHTRRLTSDDLPVYTALNLAMSAVIDRPLSAWEESFLPMRLREHVRSVRVVGEDGRLVPLVRSEMVLFEADRPVAAAEAPDRWPGYLAAGTALGALFLALGGLAARGRRAGRYGLVAAGGAWVLAAGVLGTVIAALWALTNHYVTYGNENLLQINPLPLALAGLLPLAVLRGRAVRAAAWLAWSVAALSAAGLLLQLLPAFDQVNGEIIALALPAHFGLAGALRLAAGKARGRARAS